MSLTSYLAAPSRDLVSIRRGVQDFYTPALQDVKYFQTKFLYSIPYDKNREWLSGSHRFPVQKNPVSRVAWKTTDKGKKEEPACRKTDALFQTRRTEKKKGFLDKHSQICIS